MILFIQTNPMIIIKSPAPKRKLPRPVSNSGSMYSGLSAYMTSAEARRQDPEHVGADATFSGERLDVTAQALALRHRLGDRHQQLGEVAADLALDADGHDGPGEVGAVHALGDGVERLLERTAETGLGDDPAQLAAHRLGDLLRHGLDALHHRVAGPQRARQQLERVGQLRLELLLALAGQEVQHRRRQQQRTPKASTTTKMMTLRQAEQQSDSTTAPAA